MNYLEQITCLCILTAVLAVMGSIGFYRKRVGRILNNMNKMLDEAMNGTFKESSYDESMVSAVETRLAHYLTASEVSAKNLKDEKNKIKELIGDISHQTKTPIANLLLYTELLEEQEMQEKSKEYVAALKNQTEKLNFLIRMLVKTSRLETGIVVLHTRQQELFPILCRVQEQIAQKAEVKKIQILVEPAEEMACLDAKWSEEALYNIVDNAVKYTESGGVVKIRTQAYELFCRVDVTDTGIGISEEEQVKIFGRFYRGKHVEEIEGLGIGLHLARQILEEEGGYIKVQSQIGKGTTFSVFFQK